VRFGDLAFFTSRCGLGDSGSFGAASGFYALCGSGAGGLFGLAQRTAHRWVSIFWLMGASSQCSLTRSGLRSSSSGFCFGLSQQRLLTNLFGGTVPQLRAILPARSGEVTIFCSVEVRPGVEYCHIFRGLRYCRIIDPVRTARIHLFQSCFFQLPCWFYLNCAGSLPVQNDVFAPVIMQ
jgi:hypothetical protein